MSLIIFTGDERPGSGVLFYERKKQEVDFIQRIVSRLLTFISDHCLLEDTIIFKDIVRELTNHRRNGIRSEVIARVS